MSSITRMGPTSVFPAASDSNLMRTVYGASSGANLSMLQKHKSFSIKFNVEIFLTYTPEYPISRWIQGELFYGEFSWKGKLSSYISRRIKSQIPAFRARQNVKVIIPAPKMHARFHEDIAVYIPISHSKRYLASKTASLWYYVSVWVQVNSRQNCACFLLVCPAHT